jgi:uncharacterized protein (TIGR02266 family)
MLREEPRLSERLSQPDSIPMSQRRSFPRIDAEIEIDFESDHTFFSGFSENLSDGGLFVATYAPRKLGERLHVRFTLPGIERAIDAHVEVRWLRPYDAAGEHAPGFGAAFLDLGDADRDAIHAFLKHRAPLFFDA